MTYDIKRKGMLALEEAIKGKFSYAKPTKSDCLWLKIESSDGYQVSAEYTLGGFRLSSNYDASRECGTGESLAKDLSADGVIAILEEGVSKLFFVRNAPARHMFKDGKFNKSHVEYKLVGK